MRTGTVPGTVPGSLHQSAIDDGVHIFCWTFSRDVLAKNIILFRLFLNVYIQRFGLLYCTPGAVPFVNLSTVALRLE
jgi:hypothetical protein